MSTFVSVVVPVLNRERDIGRCIEALLAQDSPNYEIIVVDNNSSDATRDVVRRYPVRLLVEKHRNPYKARNLGIRSTSGDIVAFTDSDCVPEPQWLSRLVEAYEDENVGGVGSLLLPLPPSNKVEAFLGFGRLQIFSSNKRAEIRRDPDRFLSGGIGSANMSYRRSVLTRLNMFDEEYSRFCGSYDLCWRVQEAGYRVLFEPSARVHHHMRGSVRDMCAQFYSFGIGQIHLLKKQGRGWSFIDLKSYLFPTQSKRIRLPFQSWLSLDACHAVPLLLIPSLIWPMLLLPCMLAGTTVFAGAMRGARSVVKATGQPSWYALYPLLHLVRIYALTAGRIAGGIRYRIPTL